MITQMAEATPIGRCKVLKELAGFTYYDEKRKVALADLKTNESEERDVELSLTATQKVFSRLTSLVVKVEREFSR